MGERRDDPKLYWLDPRLRAVLPLDGFHLPQRLARTIRAGRFEVTADTAFADVVRACAEPRPGHPESWINEPIVALYGELHRARPCPQRRMPARRPAGRRPLRRVGRRARSSARACSAASATPPRWRWSISWRG